ncbi:hypothetical protein WMW72_33990 [Paenibacillus filicis]|uniref:Uncharacterized protein n=1 Tax=Paenibacillus filicis TaxID=669464 RepID=A0ABU9DVK2_9BACL
MGFSFARALAILNAEFRTGTVYLALYTSNPTASDTGTEVTGGGYARQVIPFSAPAVEGGKQSIKNNVLIQFPVATADWGTITHIAIRSAVTGGTMTSFGALTSPRTIMQGDRFVIEVDSGVVRLV